MSRISQPKGKSHKPIGKFINKIVRGDALKILKTIPGESIDCIVTSPPYWALRDYGVMRQIGLESTIEEYLDKLLPIFDELKRVLKSTGTCWINLGDTYADKTKGGHRNKLQGNMYDSLTKRVTFAKLKTETSIPVKSLCLIPSRFAIEMIKRGWILRNEIIWHKPNAMPQSAKDRFSVDFEKLFFFVKSHHYYFKQQFEPLKSPERLKRRLLDPSQTHKQFDNYWTTANPKIPEIRRLRMLARGRNKRCVWTIGTTNFAGNHFAVFPSRLVETPILAGCPEDGIVLDPFIGSGTTAVVAKKLNRNFIGIELSPEYLKIARKRLQTKGF